MVPEVITAERVLCDQIDTLAQFYTCHVYGAYKRKDLHATRWLPALIDPNDGKLVHTAKPLPRYEPRTCRVKPGELCAPPFQLLRGKVPKTDPLTYPGVVQNVVCGCVWCVGVCVVWVGVCVCVGERVVLCWRNGGASASSVRLDREISLPQG